MDSGGSNLENVIDRILFSANELKKKLQSVREYCPIEDGSPSHQQQNDYNKKIKDLERENIELRQALEDHQYGLEFIMSKYRSQVSKLVILNSKDCSD